MKVAISVFGRFHLFNLAEQMAKRNQLAQLITSYPKFETVKYGVPRSAITSILPAEVVNRVLARMPFLDRLGWNSQYFRHQVFENAAAPFLKPGADIFVGLSSFSLKPLRRAQSFGMIGVIERGSSHMLHQQQILADEFAKFGMLHNNTHPRIIEHELMEYEQADYISIPSTFVERSFIEQGVSRKKLIRVPYGADLSQFYPVPKEDKIFRVIFVGNLSFQKGSHYLLQAFHELALPGAELWLVDIRSPEMEPFLARYDSPNIVLKGHQPQSRLKWFYGQCSVFCLPSIQDGFGMVLCQAIACGLPLICTTNTGGEDIIGSASNGFVVPIRDVPALKDRIRWCYENQEACRAMGERARTRKGADFSWNTYGSRITAAYEGALASRKAGDPYAFRRVRGRCRAAAGGGNWAFVT